MMIAIASDAWEPQINGVVRTWQAIRAELRALGHEVAVLSPSRFSTVPAPRYPEIRIALMPGRKLPRIIDELRPDVIHIATEGPVGQATWRHCRRHGIPFTTSFHTHWAQYNRQYFGIPERFTWRLLQGFHGHAATCLVPTERIKQELIRRGLDNAEVIYRGVDTSIHYPLRDDEPDPLEHLPRPVLTYVGRIAMEKNIHAFLDLDLPGTKVVVGDGPLRESLAARYPQVWWAGYKTGRELGRHYAGSDVVVLPSRTETFGLVALESAACGTPVAAYPVGGPGDVVVDGFLRRALGGAGVALLALEEGLGDNIVVFLVVIILVVLVELIIIVIAIVLLGLLVAALLALLLLLQLCTAAKLPDHLHHLLAAESGAVPLDDDVVAGHSHAARRGRILVFLLLLVVG